MNTRTSAVISLTLTALAGAGLLLTGCGHLGSGTGEDIHEAGIPKIFLQPLDLYVSSGEREKFEVEARGHELSYQWYKLEVTNETESIEVPLAAQTNSYLEFSKPTPDDYGLYFCQILNHPPTDQPPYGVVRETRTRLVSLSGPTYYAIINSAITPPQEGTVVAGPGGENSCMAQSPAYVTFAGSGGSGYPNEPNTASVVLSLTNAGKCISTTRYAAAFNEAANPFEFHCMTPTTNHVAYSGNFTPQQQRLIFTISFTGNNPPAAGTKVIMGLNWK